MLIATEFEILRGVIPNSRVSMDMERKPVRVATIINEAAFVSSGHKLVHHENVFLEDYVHDWDWSLQKFRYYARVEDAVDVLVVYAEMNTAVIPRFCGQCGRKVGIETEFVCKECTSE